MKLVIIAAGEGSRIRSPGFNLPKTLLEIGPKTILSYLLDNCRQTGITDCVVVTGYRHERIEDFLKTAAGDLNVETVRNSDWKLANGVSVLAAEPLIPNGDDFMVSMSDHLYGPELLDSIANSSLSQTVANVGLDFKTDAIFDLDDAMKVAVDPSDSTLVTGMSKQLSKYDAIDCGVFKCRFEFFQTLQMARDQGACSLADACALLIANRQMGGVDIGDQFWIDIDTPEAARIGQKNVQLPSEP